MTKSRLQGGFFHVWDWDPRGLSLPQARGTPSRSRPDGVGSAYFLTTAGRAGGGVGSSQRYLSEKATMSALPRLSPE